MCNHRRVTAITLSPGMAPFYLLLWSQQTVLSVHRRSHRAEWNI